MAKPETGIRALAKGRSDIYNVDPRSLHIKPTWNSRDFNDPANVEHIETLAQSIAAVGVKNALIVYFEDGKAWVADGECRLRATLKAINELKAPIETIPVRTEDRFSNEADRLINQFIRNTGKPFTQIELSNHFKRLLGMGMQVKGIAEKTGLSQARISQILGLQTLPEGIKQAISSGQVAASTAVAIVKEHGSEAEKQLKAGIEAAKEAGRDKVKPSDIVPAEVPAAGSGGGKVNVRTALKELFEGCDWDDDDPSMVVVSFPMDKWKLLRDLLDI